VKTRIQILNFSETIGGALSPTFRRRRRREDDVGGGGAARSTHRSIVAANSAINGCD